MASDVTDVTKDAASPGFNYYGRWHRGKMAVTINSGALVEFAYTGRECSLVFDVKGFTQFPAIFVQTDGGTVSRTTLAAKVSSVSVTPDLKQVGPLHLVRCWVAAHSLYQTPVAGKQWETLDGGCRFLGVILENGELVPLPYGKEQIEFLGDSITQGLRLLYNGKDDDTGQQEPFVNWPQLTAENLFVKPIVTGFGGPFRLCSRLCLGVLRSNPGRLSSIRGRMMASRRRRFRMRITHIYRRSGKPIRRR